MERDVGEIVIYKGERYLVTEYNLKVFERDQCPSCALFYRGNNENYIKQITSFLFD